MSAPREPRSIIEAAEQAAAAGDYTSAEELLREAALLQEETLGPLDPDLANTLNNLGVVCEITDKPDAAEQCFRRAFAIATAVLDPDHPFVSTSRNNLRDFCEARGKAFEELADAAPAVVENAEAPAAAPVEPARELRFLAESYDSRPSVRARSIRPMAIAVLGPAAMLIMVLTTARPGFISTERPESRSAMAMALPREDPAPPRPHVPAPVEPIAAPREIPAAKPAPLPVEPIPSPAEAIKKKESSNHVDVSASRTTAASRGARPTVVKARLCAELDEWRCDPADRPVPSGPLFFYTQVKSTRATTIQHRWYQDNRLRQSVELRVQANPGIGYRTFSRSTMTSDSAGTWRVELRSSDGVLLHEERFSVH